MIPSVINFPAVVSTIISSFGSILGVIVGGIICFIILRIAVDRWLLKIEAKRDYEGAVAEQDQADNFRTDLIDEGLWDRDQERSYRRNLNKFRREQYDRATGYSPHRKGSSSRGRGRRRRRR